MSCSFRLRTAKVDEGPSLLCCPAGVHVSERGSQVYVCMWCAHLVTAQINCGLKTNLLFLNRDGMVLKMWFPLEVRARVMRPPLQRRRSARG